ncbi:uncharacterized protein LOC62_01G001559 [Vanrija pseudolonga]|uniref:Uncharacterized protein n=1 Tax=Vanrija pseudolonga TaxID=143232 RepID=A0AAF0Y727_9TREE|nr:hypothetical protein LOC62_01G001559 [Vanrija pseudolonga]
MPGIQIIANNEAPKQACLCPRCDFTYAGAAGVNISNVSSSSSTSTTAVNTSSATVAATHTATQTIVYNHDVSVSLAQINELTVGPIIYALPSHQVLTAVAPVDPKGTPLTFTFNPRLVRDHLHRQFLSYLAEGVHGSFFVKGTAAAKIHDARQVLAVDRLDGYASLQSFVYAHLLGSVNVALLEQAPRNSTLDGARIWAVSSPDRCRLGAQAALELRIAGIPHVAADFHPATVVPNALIDAVLNAVRLGAVWDLARGRVVAAPVNDNQSLHHDAQILLGQVWDRFARGHASNASVNWVILFNVERSLIFHRRGNDISVSHVISATGVSNTRNSVQNIYSLLLAIGTLEKHQYFHGCPKVLLEPAVVYERNIVTTDPPRPEVRYERKSDYYYDQHKITTDPPVVVHKPVIDLGYYPDPYPVVTPAPVWAGKGHRGHHHPDPHPVQRYY